MHFWVIYRSPRDYPGKHVVRRWHLGVDGTTSDEEPDAVVDTIEAARDAVPPGRVKFDRSAADDPAIAEVWL